MGGIFSSQQRRQEKLVKEALGQKNVPEWATADAFSNIESLQTGLRKAGLESSNLIVAVDFTKSNSVQGERTFGGRSLHHIDEKNPNPYEQVLSIMAKTLGAFDDDQKIPAYAFGDSQSRHSSLTPFLPGACPCNGIEQLLDQYRKNAAKLDMSGPTSYAPAINKAIDIVRDSGNQFHILLIIADGQVSEQLHCLEDTRKALIRATECALSVVVVGVGDGPFNEMNALDDDLPERAFDNLQFVDWSPFQEALASGENPRVIEPAFAVCALQEVPQQYRTLAQLGLLETHEKHEKRALGAGDYPPAKRARQA